MLLRQNKSKHSKSVRSSNDNSPSVWRLKIPNSFFTVVTILVIVSFWNTVPLHQFLGIHVLHFSAEWEAPIVTNKNDAMEIPPLARLVVGIMTGDFMNEDKARTMIRRLFSLDPRICRLGEWKEKTATEKEKCHLVYTFLVGGNPKAEPVLLDESVRPFLVDPSHLPDFEYAPPGDLTQNDVLFLNIR